jgi:hypothetical protein
MQGVVGTLFWVAAAAVLVAMVARTKHAVVLMLTAMLTAMAVLLGWRGLIRKAPQAVAVPVLPVSPTVAAPRQIARMAVLQTSRFHRSWAATPAGTSSSPERKSATAMLRCDCPTLA